MINLNTRGTIKSDLILTNLSDFYDELLSYPPLGLSPWLNKEFIAINLKRPSSIHRLGRFLCEVPWDFVVNSSQSCNQHLSNFTDIINYGLDTLAPLKAVKVHHNDQSWMKSNLKCLINTISGIGALKRMRPFVPSSTLKYIYSSIIQPHFDYCCVVWDNCSKSSADKLQKLQNRAARMLTFSSYDTNADLLIKRLGWRKLDSQRKIQKVTMVYKSLNGLNPDYSQPLFNYRNSVINYTLRDTEGKLTIPMPRTNYLKNSFGYSGAELWNNLPIHVKQAVTLKQFKAGCSNYFI